MKIVVDANIMFAAIIKSGLTRRILLFSGYDFYSPEYSVTEFKKYLPYLQEKTGLNENRINALVNELLKISGLKIVSFKDFKSKKRIAEIISPDENDVAYFALALHLDCAIWSNDKALKKQKKVKIRSTEEMIKIFDN